MKVRGEFGRVKESEFGLSNGILFKLAREMNNKRILMALLFVAVV
jgi:hypothetical protein